MAEIDHVIAQWISYYLPYLLASLLLLWVLKMKGSDLRHRWFAFFMHYINKATDPKIEELKKDFFSSLNSITSHDPELRKKKGIKILEIGVGTGVNFQYYPDGSHLIVVDPNPHFAKYYDENRKKFPNIHSEEILITTGEEMTGVADNSVDVVVVTLVLCSVGDAHQILKQVVRVLVPGGKLYILEHIKEFNPDKYWIRSVLQEFLSVSGIWPFLFDGCCLNRDFHSALDSAGFSKVEAEKFYVPLTKLLFLMIKPHLKAIAVK
uniref:Methyltransferase type 11 domain-containing protein n=2 Tax=Scylla olivacea TaxID=85551 RepID=A0A0P4WD28_SCYOL